MFLTTAKNPATLDIITYMHNNTSLKSRLSKRMTGINLLGLKKKLRIFMTGILLPGNPVKI